MKHARDFLRVKYLIANAALFMYPLSLSLYKFLL